MSIFLFIKNGYNRVKYNRAKNKPILEKARKIKNDSFKLSKALDNLGVINYVGNDGLVYGIFNDQNFIFNCDFSIQCNEKFISHDNFIIHSNRVQSALNVNSYEKDLFTKAIIEKIEKTQKEKIHLMDSFLFIENKLKESINDLVFQEYINEINNLFDLKYDMEKNIFYCSSVFKTKSYITSSYISIEFILRIFDDHPHQVNIIFPDREKKSIEIKKTDDVKHSLCMAIVPYLLKKEGCDLLGINSVDEFSEDLYNNLKLLCY